MRFKNFKSLEEDRVRQSKGERKVLRWQEERVAETGRARKLGMRR